MIFGREILELANILGRFICVRLVRTFQEMMKTYTIQHLVRGSEKKIADNPVLFILVKSEFQNASLRKFSVYLNPNVLMHERVRPCLKLDLV